MKDSFREHTSKVSFRNLRRFATTLWRDESGVILPYVTLLLVVIIGVSLLALDGGRGRSLQTQLQNAADSLALAGAAELNRAPGARDRATNAINNLVSNGLAGMGISIPSPSITFYETLPQAGTYFTTGKAASDDGHARFVAVTFSSVTMDTIFPVSFLSPGAANSFTAGAAAVAGFDEVACQYTPMFICNPYETSSMTYDQATGALINASTGGLVALQGASNSQYSPGNFGWVAPPITGTVSNTCGSGNAVSQSAAQAHPATCFNNTAINTKPGNIANTDDALNTRFDLYAKSFNNCGNNSLYPPAANVRKGYIPGAAGKSGNLNYCNPTQQTPYPSGNIQAMGYPLDSNMLNSDGTPNMSTTPTLGNGNWPCADISTNAASTCSGSSCTLTVPSTLGVYAGMGVADATTAGATPPGTFVTSKTSTTVTLVNPSSNINISSGDGIRFAGYWSTAHPGVQAPASCNNTGGMSRYSIYNYEIDNGRLNDQSLGQEVGAPMCSTATADRNRRLLFVAVLNCLNLEAEGYSLNGAASNLPVAAFAKFFMTSPVTSPQGPILAEYVGIANPGDQNPVSLFYQVQLYR